MRFQSDLGLYPRTERPTYHDHYCPTHRMTLPRTTLLSWCRTRPFRENLGHGHKHPSPSRHLTSFLYRYLQRRFYCSSSYPSLSLSRYLQMQLQHKHQTFHTKPYRSPQPNGHRLRAPREHSAHCRMTGP